MTRSDRQWAEAARRATGPAPSRRFTRRAWAGLLGSALVIGAVIELVKALLPSGPARDDDPGSALPPFFWPGLATAGGAVLIVGVLLVVGIVTKRLVPEWERPDGALSWRQGRSARRQIRGAAPVEEEHRVVLQAIARQDVRSAPLLLACFVVTATGGLGLAVALGDLRIDLLVGIPAAVLLGVALWQGLVQIPASRRFLASR